MSTRAFDAFAAPPGVAVRGYGDPLRLGGLTLRTPDTAPVWIEAVAESLTRAREGLLTRPVADIAVILGGVGARFLDPDDPIREEAVALLPATAGLSRRMAVAVLDGMAVDWTTERLRALLKVELGEPSPLDELVPRHDARAMAVGPELTFQVVAGGVPGVGVHALLRSLLVKSPTLLKPGLGDTVLPVLFARALRESDPDLAGALGVLYWSGGSATAEDAAIARAEVVVAYGSDQTVADLRARAPATTRFVAYHHRVSVGLVGREALTADRLGRTAAGVAAAVGLLDQRGCVSPQAIYVESGGDRTPEEFTGALADALRELEERLPFGALASGERSELHQARGTAELLVGAGPGRLVHGGEAPWTVALEDTDELPLPSMGRVVRVRPVADAIELPERLRPLRRHLQTVGVAGLGGRLDDIARRLAVAGASRVVPFEEVSFPPPWWHHDGGGPLRDLVRWVDVARG